MTAFWIGMAIIYLACFAFIAREYWIASELGEQQ